MAMNWFAKASWRVFDLGPTSGPASLIREPKLVSVEKRVVIGSCIAPGATMAPTLAVV